jgi:PAS domain S-box-containing protein
VSLFRLAPPTAACGPEASIESGLLYVAYDRSRLNAWMTVACTLIFGLLLCRLLPCWPLAGWLAALLANSAALYWEGAAFQRAAPKPDALARWHRLYVVQSVVTGAVWAIGPVLMLPQAAKAETVLLVGILLCVGAVTVARKSEQRVAMQVTIIAMLVPPAVASWFAGNDASRVVAAVLVVGLVLMIVVGRASHRSVHTLLRTQSILRESEGRFRTLVEWLPDAVGVHRAGVLIYVNPAAIKMFNARTAQDLIGTAVLDRVHPDFHALSIARMQSVFDQVEMPLTEMKYLKLDGSPIDVESQITSINYSGESAILFVCRDIAARKATERQLALFRRVFDSSSQCIGIADHKGRFIYQNPAQAHELGYSADEIAGQPFTMVLDDDRDEDITTKIIESVVAGGNWVGEVPLQRKNGSRFISLSNISCIQGERGPTQYFFNIFCDFSAELARRNELSRAKEAADQATRAKSEFLSRMSHELRTPMNAILGFSQLMKLDATLPDAHKDNVHEITTAGRHLLALINKVLDLAKIESGHLDLAMEPVEVGAVALECLNLVRPLAEMGNVKLGHTGLHGAAVLAERMLLKQVLLNLLSNAIKYNRPDGSVHLDARPHGPDRLRILVTDTGVGIPAVRLKELSQPFNRLDAEISGIEGTGIGLTIARAMLESMGGTVGVESELGVGSTFWFELPLASMPEADHKRAHSATAGQHIAAVPHTVLYIEDSPANLKLVTQILGHRKHIRLHTAHSPELGIELALAYRPALILLDINMPGMNGYQVMEAFKGEASLRETPVVAVTANAMFHDIERGREAGFAEYITKPFNVDEFLETIDRCLSDG